MFSGRIVTFLPTESADELEDRIKDASTYLRETLPYGRAIVMTTSLKILTTTEAAKYLGISRPTLVKILERGEIPFEWNSSQRIIQIQDLETYRRTRGVHPYAITRRSYFETKLRRFLELIGSIQITG